MKMLVHQRDLPRRAGLRFSVLGFADDDDRRRSERGERRQQVRRKLPWALVGVSGEFCEAFRWTGMMSQKLGIIGDQQKRCGHIAPVRPDLVLDERRKTVELSDPYGVGRRS